jgi:hypothetical protein
MALWPATSGGTLTAASVDTSTSAGAVAAVASATPHTKGSWTEVIASTASAAQSVILSLRDQIAANGADTGVLLDLGIGAAASETVLVADLALGSGLSSAAYELPIRVPSGSRLAVRAQSTVASKAVAASVLLRDTRGWEPAPRCSVATTYGANTGTSAGVPVTAPGANNTKGAWTEITSSTTRRARYLLPMLALADSSVVAANGLVDIGIGGSGSESVLISNVPAKWDNLLESLAYPTVPLPVNLAPGVRLSARIQKSGGLTDLVTVSIIAFD